MGEDATGVADHEDDGTVIDRDIADDQQHEDQRQGFHRVIMTAKG